MPSAMTHLAASQEADLARPKVHAQDAAGVVGQIQGPLGRVEGEPLRREQQRRVEEPLERVGTCRHPLDVGPAAVAGIDVAVPGDGQVAEGVRGAVVRYRKSARQAPLPRSNRKRPLRRLSAGRIRHLRHGGGRHPERVPGRVHPHAQRRPRQVRAGMDELGDVPVAGPLAGSSGGARCRRRMRGSTGSYAIPSVSRSVSGRVNARAARAIGAALRPSARRRLSYAGLERSGAKSESAAMSAVNPSAANRRSGVERRRGIACHRIRGGQGVRGGAVARAQPLGLEGVAKEGRHIVGLVRLHRARICGAGGEHGVVLPGGAAERSGDERKRENDRVARHGGTTRSMGQGFQAYPRAWSCGSRVHTRPQGTGFRAHLGRTACSRGGHRRHAAARMRWSRRERQCALRFCAIPTMRSALQRPKGPPPLSRLRRHPRIPAPDFPENPPRLQHCPDPRRQVFSGHAVALSVRPRSSPSSWLRWPGCPRRRSARSAGGMGADVVLSEFLSSEAIRRRIRNTLEGAEFEDGRAADRHPDLRRRSRRDGGGGGAHHRALPARVHRHQLRLPGEEGGAAERRLGLPAGSRPGGRGSSARSSARRTCRSR